MNNSSRAFRAAAFLIGLIFLASCTSSGQVNETLASNSNTTQTDQSNDPISENALAASETATPAETVTNAQTQQGTQVAAFDTKNAMTFLPVQGAPQTKVTLLSKSLKRSAETQGLTVLPASQQGAAYKVKGYFSALNDGSGTLLIYIWDIMDSSGNRIHRINGQERTSTSKSDPWQAITDSELARVADATAQRLKSWVETN